jgi:hypothetical protein
MQISNNIEHWRLVDGYDNYEISSHGRVRNNQTNRIMKGQLDKGYHRIPLRREGATKVYSVHRLVAFAFCENNEGYDIVDHIDRNPSNNHFTNLRWVTQSLNIKNTKISSNNISGIKGVSFEKSNGKWRAAWTVEGKRMSKRFENKDDAVAHRQEMEKLHNYL